MRKTWLVGLFVVALAVAQTHFTAKDGSYGCQFPSKATKALEQELPNASLIGYQLKDEFYLIGWTLPKSTPIDLAAELAGGTRPVKIENNGMEARYAENENGVETVTIRRLYPGNGRVFCLQFTGPKGSSQLEAHARKFFKSASFDLKAPVKK